MLKEILFLLIFVPLTVLAAEQEWKLVSDIDQVKLWRHQSHSETIGTYQKISRYSKINWSDTKNEEFFRRWESKRKEVLAFMGVTQWKANSYKWKKKKSPELYVKGEYKNPSGDLVYFEELHVFEPQSTTQFLFTTSVKNKFKAQQFFEFARKEVGK